MHDDKAAQDTAHVAGGSVGQDTAHVVAGSEAQDTAHVATGRAAQDTKIRLWLRRLRHKELVTLKTQILTSEVATRV